MVMAFCEVLSGFLFDELLVPVEIGAASHCVVCEMFLGLLVAKVL